MSDYQGQQHFIRNKNESMFIKVHSVNRNIWLHNSLKANSGCCLLKYKKLKGKMTFDLLHNTNSFLKCTPYES